MRGISCRMNQQVLYLSAASPAPENLQVIHATCPHAGCAIGYSSEGNKFRCPCHNSAFEIDGCTIEPSPSPAQA